MASSMELEKDRLLRGACRGLSCPYQARIRVGRAPSPAASLILCGRRRAAARGRELFYSKEMGCSRCHGDYDGRGKSGGRLFRDVGTDRSRLDIVSDGFTAAFNDSPLANEGALVKNRRYAATPLTGVWELPLPAQWQRSDAVSPARARLARPKVFEVMAAKHLDRERTGQQLYTDPDMAQLDESELLR